jgi:hypothetical protein
MLRCVTIYHPYNSFGALTVASQHRQYFQTQNDDRDPRVAFLEDFEVELQEWIDLGDHVVVGGDINEDVSHPDIEALFLRHGLHNVIFSHHDRSNAPPTFSRGNRVIDGLWATAALDISACRYFAPGETTSDHLLLWMDVFYDSALGHNPPFPSTFQARRLCLFDSKAVAKYLKYYKKTVRVQQLIPRQIALRKALQYGVPLTPGQAQEAETIDLIRTRAMLAAEESKCHKLCKGAVAFSLATESPCHCVQFWILAIKLHQNGRVNLALWNRKKTWAKITESFDALSLDELRTRLLHAQQDYGEAKKSHKESQVKFLDTLNQGPFPLIS